MKSQLVMIVTILLLATTPLTTAFAQQKKNNSSDDFRGNRGRMWSELNLTSEQKDQIAKLRLEHQKEALDIRNEIEKSRLDIKELMVNKNIDEAKILSLTDKISGLQAKLKRSSVNMWLNTYKLLTDEQKQLVRDNFPGFGPGEGRGFMRGKGGRGFRRGGAMGQGAGFGDGGGLGLGRGMNPDCVFNN